jgi:hypothetical protein
LKDGDRVALIGNTFVEREQDYSYLETLLRARWPERKIRSATSGGRATPSTARPAGTSMARAGLRAAECDRARAQTHGRVHLLRHGREFRRRRGAAGFKSGLEHLLDTLKT